MANPTDDPSQDDPALKDPLTGVSAQLAHALKARRGALTALAVLIALAVAANGLWKVSAPSVSRDAKYLVTPESLTLTIAPAWVGDADVASEAFQQAGLAGQLSVLDPPERLEQRVVDALRGHPWVRSVGRLEKSPPNRLLVEVEYRRPIAVAVLGDRLAPLDAEAVLLPSDGLLLEELSHLPRIQAGPAGGPAPRVGQPWPSPKVAGGAALVAALAGDWRALDLFEVRPNPVPEARGAQRFHVYELLTTGNTRIEWGAAPGFAPPGESPAAEKLARLRQFVARHGPLDSVSRSPEWIDIRSGLKARRRIVKNESPDAPKEEIIK